MNGILRQFINKETGEVLNNSELKSFGAPLYGESGLEDRKYIYIGESGIQLLFELDEDDIFRLSTIFLSRSEEVDESLGKLIGSDVRFDQGRSTVRKTYGQPVESGKFGQKTILGVVPPWDKFLIDVECTLHFEYSFDTSNIEKITMQKKEQ